LLAQGCPSGRRTHGGGCRVCERSNTGCESIFNFVYDAAGQVQQEWVYYPFGQTTTVVDTLTNPYTRYWIEDRNQFAGMWRDDETGTDHTLHRHYANNLAREILTRVAAQASDPVSATVTGARIEIGFAPRSLA
jgi:hypothetical protein